ncbi:MAG: NERD domain-containing protein [Chloroflexi bacterium]|nr:NERD domain-containing protein [Chloroflexota bacterium]MCL5108391.1 NERD domain-containing protein [Chloroflexota bacterium]
MQVVVNERFLQRWRFWSRVMSWGGGALLAAGYLILIVATFVEPLSTLFNQPIIAALMWVLVIGGFTAFNTGRSYHVRWVMRPREDEVLAFDLKGLDHRYRFFNYLPLLPSVLHVLIGPSGIFVMHVRRQDGVIVNQGSKWRRKTGLFQFLRTLFEGSFGNPTQDALRETEAVRKLLASEFSEEELEGLPFQPMIVFLDARAKLTVTDPAVPVFTQKDLKAFLRKSRREERLDGEQLQRISTALGV